MVHGHGHTRVRLSPRASGIINDMRYTYILRCWWGCAALSVLPFAQAQTQAQNGARAVGIYVRNKCCGFSLPETCLRPLGQTNVWMRERFLLYYTINKIGCYIGCTTCRKPFWIGCDRKYLCNEWYFSFRFLCVQSRNYATSTRFCPFFCTPYGSRVVDTKSY